MMWTPADLRRVGETWWSRFSQCVLLRGHSCNSKWRRNYYFREICLFLPCRIHSGIVSVSTSPPSGIFHTRIFASSPAIKKWRGLTLHMSDNYTLITNLSYLICDITLCYLHKMFKIWLCHLWPGVNSLGRRCGITLCLLFVIVTKIRSSFWSCAVLTHMLTALKR